MVFCYLLAVKYNRDGATNGQDVAASGAAVLPRIKGYYETVEMTPRSCIFISTGFLDAPEPFCFLGASWSVARRNSRIFPILRHVGDSFFNPGRPKKYSPQPLSNIILIVCIIASSWTVVDVKDRFSCTLILSQHLRSAAMVDQFFYNLKSNPPWVVFFFSSDRIEKKKTFPHDWILFSIFFSIGWSFQT